MAVSGCHVDWVNNWGMAELLTYDVWIIDMGGAWGDVLRELKHVTLPKDI